MMIPGTINTVLSIVSFTGPDPNSTIFRPKTEKPGKNRVPNNKKTKQQADAFRNRIRKQQWHVKF